MPQSPAPKTWKKALLYSIIWTVLMTAGGIVHVQVVRAGHITPTESSALTARYANACVIGLMLIWILVYTQKQPKR